MARREITSLVWHKSDLHIEVDYVEGDRDYWIGSGVVAAVLADEAGLSRMPASDDVVRWVREPNAHHAEYVFPRRKRPFSPAVAPRQGRLSDA